MSKHLPTLGTGGGTRAAGATRAPAAMCCSAVSANTSRGRPAYRGRESTSLAEDRDC